MITTITAAERSVDAATAQSLRKALGLSQVKFAAKLGVDTSTVSCWERGVNQPSPLAQEKIRALLDATIAKGEHIGQRTPA